MWPICRKKTHISQFQKKVSDLQMDKVIKNIFAAVKLLQSCLTLYEPIDGSPLGSSVSGIPQARILEWVVISFSNA